MRWGSFDLANFVWFATTFFVVENEVFEIDLAVPEICEFNPFVVSIFAFWVWKNFGDLDWLLNCISVCHFGGDFIFYRYVLVFDCLSPGIICVAGEARALKARASVTGVLMPGLK